MRREPPRMAPVLTFEEHHRVTQVVTLLATVARRTHAHERRKTTKTQQTKAGIKVRLTREPCFFAQNFYHEIINQPFNKRVSCSIQSNTPSQTVSR